LRFPIDPAVERALRRLDCMLAVAGTLSEIAFGFLVAGAQVWIPVQHRKRDTKVSLEKLGQYAKTTASLAATQSPGAGD